MAWAPDGFAWWRILGPKEPYLDAAQTAIALGVSVRTLQRLVAAGAFPEAARSSAGGQQWWLALDVASYCHLSERGCRPTVPEPANGAGADNS